MDLQNWNYTIPEFLEGGLGSFLTHSHLAHNLVGQRCWAHWSFARDQGLVERDGYRAILRMRITTA